MLVIKSSWCRKSNGVKTTITWKDDEKHNPVKTRLSFFLFFSRRRRQLSSEERERAQKSRENAAGQERRRKDFYERNLNSTFLPFSTANSMKTVLDDKHTSQKNFSHRIASSKHYVSIPRVLVRSFSRDCCCFTSQYRVSSSHNHHNDMMMII